MDIATFVIGKETTEAELYAKMKEFRNVLTNGKSVAFVVRKGALEYGNKVVYSNEYQIQWKMGGLQSPFGDRRILDEGING